MPLKTLLSAAALLAATGHASAQGMFSFDPAEGGAYIAGYVGASSFDDGNYAGTGTRLKIDFDTSVVYGGAIGYRLPFKYWTYFQPRLELEVSIAEPDIQGIRLNGAPLDGSGGLEATSVLLNSYNDITWLADQKLVPFIGGGIGFSSLDLNLAGPPLPGASTPVSIKDETTVFTTTFGGGLSWRVNDRYELYGEARYTTMYDADFNSLTAGTTGSQSLSDDPAMASIMFGARVGL